MQATAYPDVNELLGSLLAQMQQVLGAKLVGLYLFGSLATGDFDPRSSDIDLLAAISSDLDEQEFSKLHAMQNTLVAERPQWHDRIEIAYLSLTALKTFRTQSSQIAIISPGEPFHLKEAGIEWLMNWYMVREVGQSLYGPAPATLIDPIAKAEFVQAIRTHALAWTKYIQEAERQQRKAQAYAILTLCRALYTSTHGEQVSKLRAARWAAEQLPQWAALIQNALVWRATDDEAVDHAATLPQTIAFVHFVIARITQADPSNLPDNQAKEAN